jgi:small GTP-binding protein
VQFRNSAFKEAGTTTLLPVTDVQSKPWCEYFLRDLFRFHMDAIKFTYSQQPPEDVRAISFTKEGLPFLPSRFLASFSALQSLDFSENNIFHVPPEIGELTQLKKLRLNNNHITRLSSCILRRLTQLEELNLGSNEISWIEGLDGLLRLKKIKLAKNRLDILPLIPSSILESLEISDNPAGSTNKDQFFRSITANVKNVDINALGLQTFPTDLLKAKGTLFLFVGSNNLSQLPMELSSFSKLQLLRADRNPFKVIPPVVFQFKTLRTLSLDGCDISVIEPHIGRLTNLRSLSLVHNRIESLPPDLFTLLELRTLEISQNRISYLPPEISNLSMLEDLGLGDNHLSQLPSTIAKLNNLITLDLSNNSLQYLNSELASLSFLQNLNLSGNPLRNPPTDIVSQGTKAVLEFLRSPLGQEVEACYRLKLMLVGQENAGKTSVLRTLRKTSGEKKEKESDVGSNVSTDGIQIGELYASLRPKEFDKKMVKVRFDTWDFAGQEVYYTSHPFFLTEQSIYLLVWNLELTDGESRVLYWLQSIFQKAPNSPVILVGTHAEAGLKQCTWIVNTAFRKYQTEFPNLFGSVAVSCVKGQIGFDKLWQTIESALQQQEWLGDFIPTRYFKLEKLLKDESIKRTPPVLTQLELTDICGTLSLAGKHLDYAKAVMERFGALFHLSDDKHLSDIVVIDLSWLINMISRLLSLSSFFLLNWFSLLPFSISSVFSLHGTPTARQECCSTRFFETFGDHQSFLSQRTWRWFPYFRSFRSLSVLPLTQHPFTNVLP